MAMLMRFFEHSVGTVWPSQQEYFYGPICPATRGGDASCL